MQLKRDTDYAIRILLVMAEQARNKIELPELDVNTICQRTAVPRQIALRLCSLLSARGFVKKGETGGRTSYKPEDDLLEKTVLSIIDAVEGQSNLLAVFDGKAEIYKKYGHALASFNAALSEELSKTTIQTIIDRKLQNHSVSYDVLPEDYEIESIYS